MRPERINTIIDYDAVQRLGVQAQGTHAIASAPLLAQLAGLVAEGRLEIPIAHTYPLTQARDAFAELTFVHAPRSTRTQRRVPTTRTLTGTFGGLKNANVRSSL